MSTKSFFQSLLELEVLFRSCKTEIPVFPHGGKLMKYMTQTENLHSNENYVNKKIKEHYVTIPRYFMN